MTKSVESVQAPENANMNIMECPACGGRHDNLQVGEFTKPYGLYTHFFQCPTTGDPGFLSLHVYGGDKLTEVSANVCKSVIEAQETGAYMVVCFRVENSEIHLSRTTKNFPKGDFSRCVDLLKRNLEDEVGAPAPVVEMKPASEDGSAPIMNLFGTAGGDLQSQVLEGTAKPIGQGELLNAPEGSGEKQDIVDANEPNVVWPEAQKADLTAASPE